MKEISFHPMEAVNEAQIKYAVVVAKYQNKWVFCRHRQRITWEIPGGHWEPGETPLETAYRELYEETGAADVDIKTIGAYRLNDYGLLCFAEIRKLEGIPEYSEIGQIGLFDTIPDKLTYAAHEQLFEWVQGWLNMQSNSGELWDIYDADRNLTGRTHRRGDFLAEGDYHLVVDIWIQNCDGQFLLTKRSPNKGFPNMWETTGGSALAGDDSLTAALREVREETGLELDPQNGRCVFTCVGRDTFRDIWLFCQDFGLEQVVLQEGETCDKTLATKEDIRKLYQQGVFIPYRYLDEFLRKASK